MMHFRTRLTLIVLRDRVMYATRSCWQGRLSIREGVLPTAELQHRPTPAGLLADALATLQPSGPVDVVLGTTWTQMDLIALPGKRIDAHDAGSVAESFALRLQAAPALPSTRLLARSAPLPAYLFVAAIAQSDRDEIVETLGRNKIRPASIQPLFAWLSLDARTRFRQREGWAVLNEPGAVLIAHLSRGELDSLRAYRIGEDDLHIDQLLLRQAAASGQRPGDTEIISIGTAAPTLPASWAGTMLQRRFPD